MDVPADQQDAGPPGPDAAHSGDTLHPKPAPEERAEETGWWSAPCGPGEVLAIALPLVISTGAWTVMNFTDRMYLLWHSQEEGAASLPAGMMFFVLVCFPLGLVSYLNTFVAQYDGAGHNERIGRAVWQGIWIGIVATPLFLLFIPAAEWIFRAAGHPERAVALEATYFRIVLWAAGANVIAQAFAAFFSGRRETVVVMWVSIAGAAINIVLDYLLIFGHAGFPEMGLAGAAWATVIADWSKIALFAIAAFTPENCQRYRLLEDWRFDWPLTERLLAFGGPSGMNLVLEVGAFTLLILFLGRLGDDALAATNMAFNVNSIAFVPMIGVGIAVSVLVGRELGAGRVELAWRATWNALGMALVYTGGFAALYLFTPDLFLLGHAHGMEAETFTRLRGLVIVLLRFVAAYCVLDAFSLVFANALKGAGDTTFVMAATLLAGGIAVAVAWIGLEHFGFDLIACWFVITGLICVMGTTFLLRFLQGAWQEMRVIEPEFLK